MSNKITGREIWKLLDGRRTLQQVADELAVRHTVPADEALAIVLAFAQRLRETSLVTPSTSDP